MATYEIGDASARTLWRALDFARRCDSTAPDLTELLELFAPPVPPTAAELAEALRAALEDHPDPAAAACDTLRRWEASQS